MKAIVSVFAKDARGITAYVTALLAERDINILDISQTLMQEYFAMIMLVDLEACPLPFHELAQWLRERAWNGRWTSTFSGPTSLRPCTAYELPDEQQ